MSEVPEVQFRPGDRLTIRAHTSKPGKGLSYPAMVVTVQDEGCSGGWDVYDALLVETGEEVSFYGFSVETPEAKLSPVAIRLLRLIAKYPGKPGTWEGFPVNLRVFLDVETLELAEFVSDAVTGGGGWRLTAKGVKVVEDFKPVPRSKVAR